MQFAILIIELPFELNRFKELKGFTFSPVYKEKELISQTKEIENYIAVSLENHMLSLMKDDMKNVIKTKFINFNIYLFKFLEFDVFRKLMIQLPTTHQIIIDNDHGCLMNPVDAIGCKDYESFIECKRCLK